MPSRKDNHNFNKGYVVLQYDLDNNFIAEHPNATRAIEALGYGNRNVIRNCCKGIQKTAYGYIWKFKDKFNYISKDKELEEKILSLYEEGYGLEKVAKLIGTTRYKVALITRNRGVYRNLSEAHKKLNQLNRNLKNENIFEKIDNEISAYWLGFILADGCVMNYNNIKRMSIHLSINDKNHLEKLGRVLNKNITVDYKYNSVFLNIYGDKVFDDLYKHGIMSNKTLNENTKVFDSINPNLTHHFLRGYFDGDGYVSRVKYPKGFAPIFGFIGSKNIVSRIRSIVVSNTSLKQVSIIERDNGICLISWSGVRNARLFIKYLYKDATVWLERKKDKIVSLMNEYRLAGGRF